MRCLTLTLMALGGCALSNPDVGALGNGKFGYTCSAQGFADASNFDTQCAPGVFSAPNFVPAAIANKAIPKYHHDGFRFSQKTTKA